MLSKIVKAACTVAALAVPGMAFAADYPTKPITLIVPYQAGGSVETMGRVFADELGSALGGKVLVKTQPGAGGKIGTTAASKAGADGYTLLFAPDSTVLWPPIAEDVDYSLESFTPIARVAMLQMAIVTSKGSGIETYEDLLAASREGKLSYADQNAISRAFVNYIGKQEGLDWVAVPTKGGGEMVPFLLGGKIDFAWSGGVHNRYLDQMNVVLGMIDAPLQRSPDVPTIQDKFGVAMPAGATIWAPAGLPEDILSQLVEASLTAAGSEAFTSLLNDKLGMPPAAVSGEELTNALAEIDSGLAKVYETTSQ
ncbi:Tripartite-type tricarboxylate transporter, receptor component TctC [Salipiger thiooxidans]|uniref:Tripartite-type tricarboxylate transporter, receptor component TctC n=1 Tax=Salipiger thiooxidans TaxID=282683 RepID=A0A1G7N2S3_9RHOB|nr:tripartite tricarboxylate transporter substrate binding protein [Salipiger thiooxidans]SDF67649.1 Tripartite-type tricarboxylate transporter, receptor component TctC [Salipiger thiooxidans]